jgi:hypothetical protein
MKGLAPAGYQLSFLARLLDAVAASATVPVYQTHCPRKPKTAACGLLFLRSTYFVQSSISIAWAAPWN